MNLEELIHSRQIRGCVAMWRWVGRGRKEITELHELIQIAACSKSYAGFKIFGYGPLLTVKCAFGKRKCRLAGCRESASRRNDVELFANFNLFSMIQSTHYEKISDTALHNGIVRRWVHQGS
jgi:hypothetical protein